MIEIIKATVLSVAAMGVICVIAHSATVYKPSSAEKDAEELIESIKMETENLEKRYSNLARPNGSGHINLSPVPKFDPPPARKSHGCRCAYCDTLNDHETGVCDRCGAPLP